jgi:hypothetical protein
MEVAFLSQSKGADLLVLMSSSLNSLHQIWIYSGRRQNCNYSSVAMEITAFTVPRGYSYGTCFYKLNIITDLKLYVLDI